VLAREPLRERHVPNPWKRAFEPGLRRALDLAVSAVAVAILVPLFAIIAALVPLTSRGPVFYRQVRIGQNRRRRERRKFRPDPSAGDRRSSERRISDSFGRPFQILKFRTMVVNAEEYGPQWSSKDDPRITTVGRLLRSTRLDETPQFLNVMRGEMSLIGPRPERPYFVDQFVEHIPNYQKRLLVRPGITGLAQVNLNYDTCIDDVKKKLEQDLEYVRSRSLVQDLKILLRTITVVFTGKGAL
jgi:lipopolysaccharide/colanic/teichoic acid biosynthesis glycosyltransferase